MGCAASKIDNEDVVRQCKERRRLMKDAVYARHHLAGAHADYCRSLRLTGSALSSFASHEPLPVSLSTPAAFLRRPSTTPAAPATVVTPPPPPPPLSPSPSTASGASSLPVPPRVPSSSFSPSINRPRNNPSSGHNGRNKPGKFKVQLPHILSESSPNSSPPRNTARAYPTAYIINNKANGKNNGHDDYDGSTYASTPSQASSVWNWENFYPPSPPDSEYFDRRATEIKEEEDEQQRRRRQQLSGYEVDEDGETTSVSEYDFFDNQKRQESGNLVGRVGSHKFSFDERCGTGVNVVDKGSKVNRRVEAEEVQCSDWGDHDYDSLTSSSDDHEGDEEDNAVRSEIGTIRSAVGESVKGRSEDKGLREEEVEEKKSGIGMRSSTISYGRSDGGSAADDMRMVVRHKDLKEIVDAIQENFNLAAAAGDQVSEMLEIGRAQMDKSFRQLKSE